MPDMVERVENTSKNRKMYLDMLRIISALAVVIFHVMKSATNNDAAISGQLQSMVNTLAEVLCWHVPVFFMITGHIWLGEDKNCTYKK